MSMDPLFDVEALQAEAEREKLLAGLPAWWHTLPDGPAHDGQPAGKCMYDAPVVGLVARHALYELWQQVYGRFGSGIRSHCWEPGSMAVFRGLDAYQLDRHEATFLDAHIAREFTRPDQWAPVPPCGHDKDAEADYAAGRYGSPHRGACRKTGCDWEGPVRDDENRAVEDAMDHAHPGWRNLPPVPSKPHYQGTGAAKATVKLLAAWEAKIIDVYPDGWLEAGGPIRTVRSGMGTRHVENATPYGGYDLALTCHLCGAAENLTWLTSTDNSVTVAGCKGGCPGKGD